MAVVLALSGAACRTHPATQVLVSFHADSALEGEAASIRVRVEGPEGEVAVEDEHPVTTGTAGALTRVPLVPRGGDATRTFRITATLLDEAGEELARVEAESGYRTHELRELHLWFDELCRDVSCEAGQTCSRGTCVGSCFESSPVGETTRSEPACGECQQCTATACVPLDDGTACGCPGTDHCEAGACVTSRPVLEVGGGQLHSCALVGSEAWCWGSDRVGQLGTEGGAHSLPAQVPFPNRVAFLAAATDHTCAITGGGQRSCWGWNGGGLLGLGTSETQPYPEPVAAPEGDPEWNSFATGWYHTCGLTRAGKLMCWGSNSRSAAGEDASIGSVHLPAEVDPRDGWTAVAAGGFHSCGLRQDGTLWCWGLNESGELGVGDTLDRSEPTQTGCPNGECIDDWIALAAGDFHTCAIREGGELWCWGGGTNGQLGVGARTVRDSSLPQRVEEGSWRAVAGGQSHTCAIHEDSTLWCWGRNNYGQLGVGDTDLRFTPARVRAPGRGTWVFVGTGREHTCAVRSNRTLWCWGRNDTGQLGLGFETTDGDSKVAVPRRVCFPPS